MKRTLLNVTLCGLLSAGIAACGSSPVPTRAEPVAGQTGPVYTGTFVLPGHARPQAVRYEVVNGFAVMEGDIVLGKTGVLGKATPGAGLEAQANILPEESYRWPGGVVPYAVDPSVSAEGRANLRRALEHWQNRTPFRFVARRSQKSYVTFTRGAAANACFSEIGRQGGRQYVFLNASGTCSERLLVHEIGHTVGLWHEHSRRDRDAWVRVDYESVAFGQAYNFDKTGAAGTSLGPYDYCSVMHYSAYAFSVGFRPTLELLKPHRCPQPVGWADRLSPGDVAAARRLAAR